MATALHVFVREPRVECVAHGMKANYVDHCLLRRFIRGPAARERAWSLAARRAREPCMRVGPTILHLGCAPLPLLRVADGDRSVEDPLSAGNSGGEGSGFRAGQLLVTTDFGRARGGVDEQTHRAWVARCTRRHQSGRVEQPNFHQWPKLPVRVLCPRTSVRLTSCGRCA